MENFKILQIAIFAKTFVLLKSPSAGIVVKPSYTTGRFVLVQRFERACFFLSVAIQKCVADEVMGIGQKVCALVGNVIL